MGGIAGAADGREFWSNLDRGSDNVRRGFGDGGIAVIWVRTNNRFDRIISIGVIDFWNPTSGCGSIATGIEVGGLAVAHAGEGGKFVGFASVAVTNLHGSSADATDTEVGFLGHGAFGSWRGAIDCAETGLVEGMTALWNNMGFFAWKTEAEAKGLKADRALILQVFLGVGDDGNGSGVHGSKWVGGGGKIIY